jgi:hypothetical protein
MQIVLQATHGVVSGAPDFFKRAFGDTATEFENILLMPHDFIFNREWYERHDPQQELSEYQHLASKLDSNDRTELLCLLSSVEPTEFVQLPRSTTSKAIQDVLPFYVPKPKHELFDIWKARRQHNEEVDDLPADERVEDACLESEEPEQAAQPVLARPKKRVAA